MDQPKHEKIVKHIILPDGTVEYVSESYYDKKDRTIISRRKVIPTDNSNYAKEVLTALSHIAKGSPTLQITVRSATGKGGVYEIVKQWVEEMVDEGRR